MGAANSDIEAAKTPAGLVPLGESGLNATSVLKPLLQMRQARLGADRVVIYVF